MRKLISYILPFILIVQMAHADGTVMYHTNTLLLANPTNAVQFWKTNDIARLSAMLSLSNYLYGLSYGASNSLTGYATTGQMAAANIAITNLQSYTSLTIRAGTDSAWWTNLWYTGYSFAWNSMTNSTGTWNKAASDAIYATGQLARVSSVNGITRYSALATSGYEILVKASGTNITATVVGTLVTVNIPSGVVLHSMRVRWPAAANSTTFTLNLGTNDMVNAGFSTRWGATFSAWREDTGAYLPTAVLWLDTSNPVQLIVNGLSTTVNNFCQFEF